MNCDDGSGFRSTADLPGKEPRLDWSTELWWAVFRWPEKQRELGRRDVNAQAREREACGG